MPTLDVFNNNAFSLQTLTEAIDKLIFVPGRLSSLGIFTERPVTTLQIMIEERSGVLQLIAPTPRGGPGHTVANRGRGVRSFVVPHFEINDQVMADEVQGVRAFGSETEVETVQGVVGDKMQVHKDSLGVTQEFSRLGAVRGIITYADGSTMNLFTEFGITPPADVFLNIAAAPLGTLRPAVADIIRTIGKALGGTPFSGVYAIAGDNFYNDLVSNSEVRATFLNTAAAAELRSAIVGTDMNQTGSAGTFNFGGIIWDNYFGQVGATEFVDPDEAHIFPLGAPGLFRTYYAPADYIETVNTLGRRLYTKQYEMDNGKGVHLDTQMNALEMCTRPGVLITAHRGAP